MQEKSPISYYFLCIFFFKMFSHIYGIYTYLLYRYRRKTLLITYDPIQIHLEMKRSVLYSFNFSETCLPLYFLQLQLDRRARTVLYQPSYRTDYHQLPAGPRRQGQLPAAGCGNRWRSAPGLVQLRDRVCDSGRHQ